MKIELKKGDITQITVDVIVNAANTSLLGGSGVDGAIHKAAGIAFLEDYQKIRNRQGKCNIGEAVITTAGNLPAKKVIHTVGPVYNDGKLNEKELLKNCYENSMQLAADNHLKSIAFPNISTGIYKYPKKEAAIIAINSVKENPVVEKVIFVCFDDENYRIYEELLN